MTQNQAFEILKMGYNIYLTGSAGSGKTFLLNKYINFLKDKNVAVGITASTGIAATHIDGITIHSWSGIGIKDELSDKEIRALLKKGHLKKRFESAKVLVIDEVSMLHSFRLDLVDKVCRSFKGNNEPFGGMQVILCGDFFQLPPINRNSEEVNFIDKSQAWDNMNLKICYLSEQHRHGDDELTEVLNNIRTNNIGEHTLAPLRKRYKKDIAGAAAITKLYTHNMDVDLINGRELEKLKGEIKTYDMDFKGNWKLADILKKSCLAPERIALKKNALVMFVKNNFKEGYVNGTLGEVIGFDCNNMPIIKTFKGREIIVELENWKIEEEGKVKAEIIQIPLRLAWAITIHKSQGMTLDAAEVDLSKSFVKGMGYVALSRVSALKGLKLMGLNKIALQVDKNILKLDKQLIHASENNISEFEDLSILKREKKQKEFLKSIMPKEKEKPISTYEKTKLLLEKKLSVAEIAKRRKMTEGTIIAHLEKLLKQAEDIDLNYLKKGFQKKRLDAIKKAFKKSGDTKLAPVKAILGGSFSYNEIKFARLFLSDK